jgi:hypothetical protein
MDPWLATKKKNKFNFATFYASHTNQLLKNVWIPGKAPRLQSNCQCLIWSSAHIIKKKLQQVKYVQCRENIFAQAKLVGWMLVTWSSRRAFIPIFFLPRESKKLSTDIGSNRASGPSSEIGGTVSGCKYNLGEKICMRKRKAILMFFKYNLWKIPTSSNKRTLAKRRLSVKENSKPSSSYKSNQKVRNNKVQNQHPTSCFF